MLSGLRKLLPGVPDGFGLTLVLASAFALFVAFDQHHWWRTRDDYSFGWLVPIFAVYVVRERWPRIQAVFAQAGARGLPRWLAVAVNLAAGVALAGGLLFFLMGALYRGASGVTQPGSLALALGLSGTLLGLVYFAVPAGRIAQPEAAGPLGWFRADARLRAVSLFLFPALIWTLSAPLVSAVENALSLFLLRKVVSVVFFVFNLLGLPLVQQGNVLTLPMGQVGVADACSGIRSLTACLFAGSFLAAVFLDRGWKKLLLLTAALLLAVFTNLLRSLFLTAWAYAYGSEAIEGTLHDATGFAILGLTCVGLLCLLPLFNAARWRRWLGTEEATPG